MGLVRSHEEPVVCRVSGGVDRAGNAPPLPHDGKATWEVAGILQVGGRALPDAAEFVLLKVNPLRMAVGRISKNSTSGHDAAGASFGCVIALLRTVVAPVRVAGFEGYWRITSGMRREES